MLVLLCICNRGMFCSFKGVMSPAAGHSCDLMGETNQRGDCW